MHNIKPTGYFHKLMIPSPKDLNFYNESSYQCTASYKTNCTEKFNLKLTSFENGFLHCSASSHIVKNMMKMTNSKWQWCKKDCRNW